MILQTEMAHKKTIPVYFMEASSKKDEFAIETKESESVLRLLCNNISDNYEIYCAGTYYFIKRANYR